MKVHAAIAHALAGAGVDTLFGLIGDGNLYVADSFSREQGGRFVAATHEASAMLMALGYASVADRVGVATVTHGPGLTNTLTALVEGVKARLPAVLVCGDTATEDRDGMQVVPQHALVAATGAGFEQLRSPATVAQDVATAIRRPLLERRPIVLNVPIKLQWQDAGDRFVPIRLPDPADSVAIGPELDKAIGVIAAARRPLIVAGRGARNARDMLLRLAARIEAPYGTTLKARGLFTGAEHDLGTVGTLSTPAAVETILEADCLLVFGAGLNEQTTSQGAFLRGKRVIQCDADPAAIGRHAAVEAGLTGDCARTAEAILGWLDVAEIPGSGFADGALAERLRDAAPIELPNRGTETTVDIRRALMRFDAAFPRDRVAVFDSGRFVRTAWEVIRAPDPRSFVFTTHFGAIGLGLPYAIGAALAAPDHPVLLVTGDGGFMLGGVAELATAARLGIDLTVLVCNDGGYGAEHIQFRRREMDPSLAMIAWPKPARLADAMDGTGFSVGNAAELELAIAGMREAHAPVVIDLAIDPDQVTPI